MNVADMFCEYIYGSFLIVEAALEVGVHAAQSLMHMLNAFIDACLSWFKYVVDLAMEAILNGVRTIQKKLVDLIWDGYKTDPKTGKNKSKFCSNLFKCNIFLDQLTDSNSLICKTLIKLGVMTSDQQQFINSVIQDFNQFSETVCNFGFTFNFGLSALKKLLMFYKEQIEKFIRMIERKKDQLRRLIQNFINRLIDSGIVDLLIKLRKFFNCVLANTDTCANINTAGNYYTNVLGILHIEENGLGGYRLNSDDQNRFINAFDSRLNKLNNSKQELQGIIDSLMNPSEVSAANNAFNLSKNIFPGGMSMTDIKNGNWHTNRMLHYFAVKTDKFLDAFVRKHGIDEASGISTEYLISGMSINDQTGEIKMHVNDIDETINMNDPSTMVGYDADMFGYTQADIVYNTPVSENPDATQPLYWNGELISALLAAIRIVQGDRELEEHVQEISSKTQGMFAEDQLVTSW